MGFTTYHVLGLNAKLPLIDKWLFYQNAMELHFDKSFTRFFSWSGIFALRKRATLVAFIFVVT